MPIVRGGYGFSTYSSGDFGTEGVIQDASATISATSTVNAEGGRSLKSSATITPTSTTTCSGERDRLSSASISATSTVTASGEGIIREDSDKLVYGTGLYGVNVYDEADLQTIVSATSSIANVSGIRVQNGSAIASVSSSATSDSEKVYQGSAISSASSSTTAHAVYTIIGGASSSAVSSTTISYIRKRNAVALVSTTSGTLAVGREKWEVIPPTATTWTTIAA